MTLISIALAALATGLPQSGQKDARAIVDQAIAAGKRLKAVRYSTTSATRGKTVKGEVLQQRANVPDSGYAAGKYWVKGEVSGGSEGNSNFEFSYDGRSLRVRLDGGAIRVLENPQAFETGQQLPMDSMSVSLPMFGEVYVETIAKQKPKFRYVGERKIGKWTCDVVEVTRTVSHEMFGDSTFTNQWAFDRASHLQVQNTYSSGSTTATSLEVNPEVSESLYKLDGKEVKSDRLSPASTELLPIGSQAPNFLLKDSAGKSRSLKDYKGKVLILDFWGTWCIPCHKLMPTLQGLHKTYSAKGLAVVGVSVNDKEIDSAAFMKRNKFTYGLLQNGETASKTYKAKLLPTFYVIDRKGKIVYRQAGIRPDDKDRLTKLVKSLL